ncbi:hypothetical protein DYU11_11210 [Fibrisoma montanum]|uniref:Uncharacterized protein n=1 Tax=Fibrisoma montanum TaxID=2305895 RepID=A0A418MAZ6_9BACT|nr:hypothetical protein [Fibrisoma montanum]RIV23548.1 hypothetical protein DYU11_11210 [Fibrisoma montanum]
MNKLSSPVVTWLRVVSLAYLVAPTFLFLLTWIKPLIGGCCALALGWVGWQAVTRIRRTDPSTVPSVPVSSVAGAGGLALAMAVVFGFGEFNHQTLDYQTNNFKFYDLAVNDWPVYVDRYRAYLCYYTAYYLPVSLLCKWWGLACGRYVSLAWSWLGLTLLWGWVVALAPRRAGLVVGLLVLFGDTWFIIRALRALGVEQHLPPNYIDLNGFMLTAMTPYSDQIAWAPQHLLPAAIGVFYVLFLHPRFSPWSSVEMVLIGLGTLLWSPFATVGLAPFMVLAAWPHRLKILKSREVMPALLILAASAVPVLSYLTSTQAMENPSTNMFIWKTGVSAWPLYYGLYVGGNFLLWVPFVRRLPTTSRGFYRLALVLLCLIPLYRIGVYNDFQMRASIAAMCVLSFCVASAVVMGEGFTRRRYALFGVVFGLNALAIVKFYAEQFPVSAPANTIERPFLHGCTNTFDFLGKMYDGARTARQYMLKDHSSFETYFMKKPDDAFMNPSGY